MIKRLGQLSFEFAPVSSTSQLSHLAFVFENMVDHVFFVEELVAAFVRAYQLIWRTHLHMLQIIAFRKSFFLLRGRTMVALEFYGFYHFYE